MSTTPIDWSRHCTNFVKGGPFVPGMCRPCWLYWHAPDYNRLWGGDGNVISVNGSTHGDAYEPESCPHLGPATGQTVLCKACKGRWELKLFSCNVYGECTTGKEVEGIASCVAKGGCVGRMIEPTVLDTAVTTRSIPCGKKTAKCHTTEATKPYDPHLHCKYCWLAGTHPRYKALWGDQTQWTEQPGLVVEPYAGPTTTEKVATKHGRRPTIQWAYGVTTVPERRKTLLPITLKSLANAGFGSPWLFIDGADHTLCQEYTAELGLQVVGRHPLLRTFGNWALAIGELFCRFPRAERFAIFQDDLVASSSLREYLDKVPYPETGYWNLYTLPENQSLATRIGKTARFRVGFYPSNQLGKGAVGLVFSRQAVITLLTHTHFIERPLDPRRGWRAIDGGIVTAFKKAGWKEYVHHPSLVQHTGAVSSMGNATDAKLGKAESFQGEEFNCLSLLNAPPDERTW